MITIQPQSLRVRNRTGIDTQEENLSCSAPGCENRQFQADVTFVPSACLKNSKVIGKQFFQYTAIDEISFTPSRTLQNSERCITGGIIKLSYASVGMENPKSGIAGFFTVSVTNVSAFYRFI